MGYLNEGNTPMCKITNAAKNASNHNGRDAIVAIASDLTIGPKKAATLVSAYTTEAISMSDIQAHRAETCDCDKPATELSEEQADGYSYESSSDGRINITKRSDRIIPLSEWLEDLRRDGLNPDEYITTHKHSVWGQQSTTEGLITLYANSFSAVSKYPRSGGAAPAPAWPVIQAADPVKVVLPKGKVERITRDSNYKLAIKGADTQIGFRILPDGTAQPFHDEKAMATFVETVRLYQPEKVTILGDFLDLAAQGRFSQEAGFARTTQMAINAGYQFLASLRAAAPASDIIVIEGNHDKRMQNFIEANALAAFGLKRADLPDTWPVMSLPYLLRLDELNIQYVDAYPAATDWDNDTTRNIHGTRANSNGSTMAQYANQLPHINTWAGHTHRAEVVYKTVLGPRGEAIESYAANPGCLCRVDGAVPSVKGAINAEGIPAVIVEDWQQGLGFLYYNETESLPQVYRIRSGRVIIDGRVIEAE